MVVPETLTQPTRDDLVTGMRETWEGMFGLPIADADGDYVAPAGDEFTGIVHISGDVEWAVVFRLPDVLARRVSGAMFDCEPGDLPDDEVRDAIGELANMIGGYVKGRVPGDTKLSLPSVTEGRSLRVAVPGTVVSAEYVAICDDVPFSVSILTRSA